MSTEELSPSAEILKLRTSLLADKVIQAAYYSHQDVNLLAMVLSNSDVVLWKVNTQCANHFLKWIPWKDDNENSKIKAISFQPPPSETVSENKIQLLIVTHEGAMHVLRIDRIISGDSTHEQSSSYFLFPACPVHNFYPTAVVWWNCSHFTHRDVAVVGGSNGQVLFFSLTHSSYIALFHTNSPYSVVSLAICNDSFRDYTYLIITNDYRQQWKLLLEKEVDGNFSVVINFANSDIARYERNGQLISRMQRTKLQEFKQLSFETFIMLKQKLNESRKSILEKPHIGTTPNVEFSKLEDCDNDGDAFVTVQQYKNRKILSAMLMSSPMLLLYLHYKEPADILYHRFHSCKLVTSVLLTNTFIYIADMVDCVQHRILVYSTRLSANTTQFDVASFVQSFSFASDEEIICLFKMKTVLPQESKSNITNSLPSNQTRNKIEQIQPEDEWSDACLVVTNKGAYIIELKANLMILAFESSISNDYSLFSRLPFLFNTYITLPKLIEFVSEKLVEEKYVAEAIRLCNHFHCYSGKLILKLASHGHVKELLRHGEWLLQEAKLDLPLGERIHLSNFVVNCYAERYLEHPENKKMRKKFLKFLQDNNDYDEEMNLYLLGNHRQCDIIYFMCMTRGLYLDTATVLTNMMERNEKDELKTLHKFNGFWKLYSEKSLIESFVLSKKTVRLHVNFLRDHIDDIPKTFMTSLLQLYDPTQPVLKPAICRMLRTRREEYEELDDANMIDWVTNYLFLNIRLIEGRIFDDSLTKYIILNLKPLSSPIKESPVKQTEFHNSQSAPILSAGYAHAALVRNGSLVTWGQSVKGCLGTGPSLLQTSAPTLNTWFDDYRIRVKQVSCGKNHTLALTENGVYSWGSSKYGQLGIEDVKQSLHPHLISSLSDNIIVGVDAGQYHSLAVDISGRLWTWGWGVYGQLGHGDIYDQNRPTLVRQLRKTFVCSARGGQAHSLVLTKDGEIFAFGCNTFGQLGIGTTSKSTTPIKMFGIQENIIMIDTNYFHNLALSDSNRLYTWGSSPQALKLLSQMQKRTRLTLNSNEKGDGGSFRKRSNSVARVEYGAVEASTSENSKSNLSEHNAIYDYNAVQTDINKHLSPTLVDTSSVEGNIMQISCGLYHSALLTTDSKIYTWGRNVDGQLGNCEKLTDLALPSLVTIFPTNLLSNDKEHVMEILNRPMWRVCCGKDYTLAVELEGRVFGWGNNNFGQLGTPPQEDVSIKRLLNKKFAGHKYAKRLVKISYDGINVVDKPTEISNMPKMQFSFSQDGSSPDRYSRLECNVNVQELRVPYHVIRNPKQLTEAGITNDNQRLHYYLECFHRYYDGDFILRTCVEKNNFLAAAKVCRLNYQFYAAFYYATKALLTFVRVTCGDETASVEEKRKNTTKKRFGEKKTSGTISECAEDVVEEAVSILETYYTLTTQFTPNKIGSFLRKCMSSWMVWNLPIKRLEELLTQHMETAAYPLAVFLFSTDKKGDAKMTDDDRISEEAWKEKNIYLHKSTDELLYSPSMANEIRSYRANKNQIEEAAEREYELNVEEMTRNLSNSFLLKLSGCVVSTMAEKSPSNFVEFVRLFRDIVYAPSILKKDDREADEILSSTLNVLRKNSSVAPKKFIQLPYEDLQGKTIEDRLIAFSCGHFTISQNEFDRDLENVSRRLNALRLFNTNKIIRQWYAESNVFDTCCPNCLYQRLEMETTTTTNAN